MYRDFTVKMHNLANTLCYLQYVKQVNGNVKNYHMYMKDKSIQKHK